MCWIPCIGMCFQYVECWYPDFYISEIGVCCLSPPCAYSSSESVLWTICFSMDLHLPCLNSDFVPLNFRRYFKIMVAEVVPNTNACVFVMCLFYWYGQNRLMSWVEYVCVAQWSACWHAWAGAQLWRHFNHINTLIAPGGYIGLYSLELAWFFSAESGSVL